MLGLINLKIIPTRLFQYDSRATTPYRKRGYVLPPASLNGHLGYYARCAMHCYAVCLRPLVVTSCCAWLAVMLYCVTCVYASRVLRNWARTLEPRKHKSRARLLCYSCWPNHCCAHTTVAQATQSPYATWMRLLMTCVYF